MENTFFDPHEKELIDNFLANGYVIFPLDDRAAADEIRRKLYQAGLEILGRPHSISEQTFFDRTHELLPVDALNDFRVKLIQQVNADTTLRPLVYLAGRTNLHWIVGNELAMQRSCNMSIQMPGDRSSLLPLHVDVWQGNSPYEIVFWLPLVDCYKSKSMYLLPRPATLEVYSNFNEYSKLSSEELFRTLKDRLVWLDVPYGHAVIFSHTLLHGNTVNEEGDTRWTFNTRFKGLLSPYASKELGESFLPITIRPATRIGYQYRRPEISV